MGSSDLNCIPLTLDDLFKRNANWSAERQSVEPGYFTINIIDGVLASRSINSRPSNINFVNLPTASLMRVSCSGRKQYCFSAF